MVARVATNHAAMTPRAWMARAIDAYASSAGSDRIARMRSVARMTMPPIAAIARIA